MGQGERPTNVKTPTDKKKPKAVIPFKTTSEPNSIKTLSIPRTPGATVWAGFYNFFAGFEENPSSGYSHLLRNLHSIEEVVDGLEKAGLRKKVAHLALVGHNEALWAGLPPQGTLTFDPPIPGSERVPANELAPEHLPAQPTPVATLAKLEPYLLSDAMLSFFMCNSGAGKEGDKLLLEVPKILPGRTIVGFCVLIGVGKVLGGKPGNACGVVEGRCSPQMDPLTPWGLAAKRARNDMIVHIPALERKGPPYRCANPQCPTHAKAEHDCKGW